MSDEKQPTAFDKWMESEDDRGYRFAAVEAVRNDLAAAFAAGQRSERVKLTPALEAAASLIEELQGVSWFPESDINNRTIEPTRLIIEEALRR